MHRAVVAAALAGALAAQTPKADAEWPTYGRDAAETHYSPLAQINASNVARLELAWSTEIGTQGNLEATPLMVDGVLYASGPWNVVLAIDARTGAIKWRYDPEIPRQGGPRICCGPVNRGVALANGKVFVGQLDGRLVALDQSTGAKVWEAQTSIDPADAYTITGAPRMVKGKVIIGNGGAESAVRGYISAYDADTGRLAWRFFTVPGDPAKGFEHPELEWAARTWTGEWWKAGGGGGTAWDAMAYDAELDLLYVGTGNGGPWDRNIRSPQGGDNLFLASILAIKPDTGRLAWHFQEVPGESWDYTATQPMILADLRIGGRDRKTILQAPKNGFFYVIDRVTGEFISGAPFARVTWATGLDPQTGRPIEAPNARYGKEPVLLFPGPPGAHNWQPMSFHPGTGLAYFPVNIGGFEYATNPDYQYVKNAGNLGVIARPGALPREPGEPPPVTAFLTAWDPVAQKERWRVVYQGGAGSGTLATGGNLVFHAGNDGTLYAYRADTGEKLWQAATAPGAATPVTYEIDGKQYVAILAGRGAGGGFDGRGGAGAPAGPRGRGGAAGAPARLWVFALP
jgi:quinohemoprotein ethanol dehydrogenase